MPDIFTSNDNLVNTKASPDGSPKSAALNSRLTREKEEMISFLSTGDNVHKLPGHTHNPLAAYCFYPDKVGFDGKSDEEKVIVLLRSHPITNLPWVIAIFFLVILPTFFPLLPFADSIPKSYGIVLTMFWYLVTTTLALEKFLSWFFNANLITDERILDVDYQNVMYREVTTANLDEIQEVTVRPTGGVESFFNYGDVLIQTAAEISRVEFEKVPNPEKVQKILRELEVQEEIEKIEGRVR
jgi:hypothetical protein